MVATMRKVMALIVIVSLIAGLAACSGTATSVSETEVQKTEATTTKVEEPVLFKFMFERAMAEYPADGGMGRQEIIKKAEKDGVTGVDFLLDATLGGEHYFTKLNLLAASNILPDVFDINYQTMVKFADEGFIRPFEDMLEMMPISKKKIREVDIEALTYKEHLYAIPVGYGEAAFNGPTIDTLLIRQDWLDKLSLQSPTTLDEMKTVMQAFVNGDPDGNGQSDTYGLGGSNASNFKIIFGAYGIIPGFWHERNGKLKKGSVLPETKEVLRLLQSWYKEGLIDPEFFITESKRAEEKFMNSKYGITESIVTQLDKTQQLYSGLLKTNPNAIISMMMPPKGPTGLMGIPEGGPARLNVRAISAKVQNVEKLAKFLDWAGDFGPDGGYMICAYGIEGKHYEYDAEKDKVKLTFTSVSELRKDGFGPTKFMMFTDRRWLDDKALEAATLTNKYPIENKFWKSVPAMIDYPDLDKLWSEYFVKIVSGVLTVDAWDEYVQKFYEQGGQKVEDQVNEKWQETKK